MQASTTWLLTSSSKSKRILSLSKESNYFISFVEKKFQFHQLISSIVADVFENQLNCSSIHNVTTFWFVHSLSQHIYIVSAEIGACEHLFSSHSEAMLVSVSINEPLYLREIRGCWFNRKSRRIVDNLVLQVASK